MMGDGDLVSKIGRGWGGGKAVEEGEGGDGGGGVGGEDEEGSEGGGRMHSNVMKKGLTWGSGVG